jgi:hypothetical protein
MVYGDIITIPTNSVPYTVYKSTSTNMATVRNFEVMSDRLNVEYILK